MKHIKYFKIPHNETSYILKDYVLVLLGLKQEIFKHIFN